MKRLLTILLMVLASCSKSQIRISASPFQHELFTVSPLIIIAGESNAGGVASNGDLSAYELAPRSSVKILNNTNLQFQSLDIGTNNLINHPILTDNATHGLENGIANIADSGLLGSVPVYIMKIGSGGSTINWWTDSTFSAFGGFAPWQELKRRADTAIKQLTVINRGIAPPIYLIWSQGINGGVGDANWKDSTKSFFTKFRGKYGSTVPIFMTRFDFGSYTVLSPIMVEIAGEMNDCYAIPTPDMRVDNYHWNAAGLKIIASTIIHTLISHYTYK